MNEAKFKSIHLMNTENDNTLVCYLSISNVLLLLDTETLICYCAYNLDSVSLNTD